MKYLSRLTALLLAFVLLFSSSVGVIAESDISDLTRSGYDQMVSAAKEAAEAEAAAAAQEAASQPIINEGGVVYEQDIPEQTKRFDIYEVITDAQLSMGGETEITLPQSGKINLSAGTAAQWQIYIPGADMWVNIAGETGDTFALTYAVIGGMLSGGSAKVRALAGDSAAVANVSVAYGSALPPVEEEDTFVAEAAAASTFSLRRSASTSDANAGIMLLDAGDSENLGTYNVVVNYVFENNEVVAEPYTANLAAGSNFSATVTFPEVQGYLPYFGNDTESTTSYDLNITNIQADVTYTVTYKPTNVDYTVIHYWQNVDNDKYTEHERETLQGLTKSTVAEGNNPEVKKNYPGFYALIYEKPEIAADGSTLVEIYYDRNYYLMSFELYGGYGTEPIYARYDADLGTIPNPTRAGYTFKGWSATDKGTTTTTLPSKMPAGNVTYYAIWEANPTAKVSVVFWGENADDENYSYIGSTTVDCEPGSEYTYTASGDFCPMIEHTHNTCEKVCEHVCELEVCYETDYYEFIEVSASSLPTDITKQNTTEDGVYTYSTGSGWGRTTYYYLKLNGKWYTGTNRNGTSSNPEREIEKTCTHTCTDACYACGKIAHTHSSACQNLWTFVESDTDTVAADGSTVINVYFDRTMFTLHFKNSSNSTTDVKTITKKWGADIHNEFPIENSSGDTILWSVPDNCENFEPGTYLASINRMPPENITFTKYDEVDAATIYYCVEVLPGESYEYSNTYNGVTKYFKVYKTVRYTKSGYLTYAEEFHDILGFKQWNSNPTFTSFDKDGKTNTINTNNYLYYSRNAYDIVYYNPTELIKTEDNVPYEMPLTNYNWTPTSDQAPVQYEPGSVVFAGWYLNPECTGEKFDFATQKMPSGPNNENGEVALSLYAKWEPVTLTVEFYLDKTNYEAGTKLSTHPDETVPHGSLVTPTPADPTNGDYTFIGWFYLDENGVEKAFDFENMPVKQNLKVYGKWSSNVLKEYTVYFKIQGTDTEIADPIKGSGLAGVTKTFDAKGGTDLYENYQVGYFPIVKSHSLTIDINATEENDTNVYTFWYVQKNAVPYTVKYLNAVTGEPLLSEKVVSDNRMAVVTETFEPISGYMPDAYQKRLVVDASNGAVNEIIFYYTEDTKHAYYKITHFTKNLDGETWTEYTSSQAVGDIGTRYTGSPLTIPGFTYKEIKYFVDGVEVTDVTAEGAKLTNEGLEINLYYVRNEYPYQVRYLKEGTGEVLSAPKNGTGLYGEVISESAIDIKNYTAVDPTSQTLTIKIEESQTEAKLNIITFYYTENEATINYVVVGPDGCGTLTSETEQVKKVTGYAVGSTATATSTAYKFVGWYKDAACTEPAVSTNATYVPVQPGRTWAESGELEKHGVWPDTTTYYAKFAWNLADLQITKEGLTQTSPADHESAIFTVTDSKGNLVATVVIPGGESVVIGNLTVDEEYTITENNDWAWRYGAQESTTVTINPPKADDPLQTFVTITNEQTNESWLGGDNYKTNVFGK